MSEQNSEEYECDVFIWRLSCETNNTYNSVCVYNEFLCVSS